MLGRWPSGRLPGPAPILEYVHNGPRDQPLNPPHPPQLKGLPMLMNVRTGKPMNQGRLF